MSNERLTHYALVNLATLLLIMAAENGAFKFGALVCFVLAHIYMGATSE